MIIFYLVVSNIFYFHPYLGRIPILTIVFFRWVETTNYIGFVCMLKLSGRHSRHSIIQQTSPTFQDEKRLNALESGDPPPQMPRHPGNIYFSGWWWLIILEKFGRWFPGAISADPIAGQEGGMKSLTKGISRLDLIAWPPVDCIFQDCTFLGGFKSCHTVQIPKLIFAVVSWIIYIILWYQKWGSSSGLQTQNIYAAFWRSIRVEVLRP